MSLVVQLVSPEQVLFEGEANRVIARTTSGGDIAFLTGHAPFLGALAISQVRLLLTDGRELSFAVHGGFIEVSHDRVTILSDVAELPAQIDKARATTAKERAEQQLRENPEDEAATAALARADLRLAVADVPAPG
jgi:F-type H+-transporting ATPase subunit epsilon